MWGDTHAKGQQSRLGPLVEAEKTADVFRGEAACSYDTWYEQPDNKMLVGLEEEALSEMMAPLKGESLLDVGCGTGYFSSYFSRQGLKVVGLDHSKDMLAVARNKGKDLPLVLGDAHRLPFGEEAFDIAMAITALEFAEAPAIVLQELYRICRRIVVLGILHRLSWMAVRRRVQRSPSFSQATFYTVRGIEMLIRRSLGDVTISTRMPFRAFMVVSIKKQ